jgi:hypothetical protein
MSKTKKHTLEFEIDYDYDMIGICSPNNDYRIVWAMNELLNIRLEKSKEDFICMNSKGDKKSEHPFYHFVDEDNYLEMFFIKNKHLAKYLIPENKQIDYFFFLLHNNYYKVPELITKLKTIPTIIGAYTFDPTDFASTENIIFE